MHPRLLTSCSLFPLVFFLHMTGVRPQVVNRSIDDGFGDSVTGQMPVFWPTLPGIWANQSCVDCAIKPPSSEAFNGTYTAATYHPDTLESISIMFDFTGGLPPMSSPSSETYLNDYRNSRLYFFHSC
jgi:hypothetical protein